MELLQPGIEPGEKGSVKLSITARHPTRDRTVLRLRGVIDHHHAANLRAAISAAAMRRPTPRRIVLDLRPVTSVDDLGLATLIVAGRVCREAGIDLTIRHASPLVRQLPGRSGRARRGERPHPAGDRAGRHTEAREPSR